MKRYFFLILCAIFLLPKAHAQNIHPIGKNTEAITGSDSTRLLALDSLPQPDSLAILLADSLRQADSLAKLSENAEKEQDTTVVFITSSAAEDSLALQALSDTTSKTIPKGTPVDVKGKRLFTLYTSLGDFPPEERAARVVRLVEKLIDSEQPIDSIKVINGTKLTTIRIGDQVIVSFTDGDAEYQNLSRLEYAEEKAIELKDFIASYREESDFYQVLLKLGLAVLTLVALSFIWKYINNFFHFITHQISEIKDRFIPSIRIKNIEIISSDKLAESLIYLNRFLSILIKISLVYAYLTFLFSLFIWTRDLSQKLIDFAITPFREVFGSLVSYVPNLLTIGIIIFCFHYIIKFSNLIFGNIAKGELKISGFYQEWADPTRKIVNFFIVLFAIILIYPYSPIANSQAAQGISIFLGILFSLGSSSAISNMIASLLLNYTRTFKIGDRIKVDNIIGDIVEKTLLVTKIRTIKNEEVSLPNSTVMGANIINYSEAVRRGSALILYAEVTLGYDVPWRKVHELLIEAAKKTERVLNEPAPYVLQLGLGDYYPTYQINVHTKDPKRSTSTLSALYANIQDAFNEAGIEILSPAYQVHRLDNNSTLPAKYLPESYSPPPIKIKLDKDAQG
ncbi:MscS Mechanosensitive ion channel [Chloroherpeton thalassium ATCC 35110]|uniref:MscS Mechanosensitive ion channel n=1 Tax=Chloroherpeton thalassium (strain ATCC 35110 / GB-78) TaxID=517418 RepID=B3QS19_CHLT3|nr:mechanosensitive ion channel family protein [Chloroherpeton thalassium]ACF13964.1 MscS Mechanosensitive ion channel [Chloroherpeton thalassium ATCC 35110]